MNLRSHIHSSYNRKLRFVNCLAQISARHCWWLKFTAAIPVTTYKCLTEEKKLKGKAFFIFHLFFCFLPLFPSAFLFSFHITYIYMIAVDFMFPLCHSRAHLEAPQQSSSFVPLANGGWGMDPITVGGLLPSRLSRWSSRRPIPTIAVTNTHNNRINKIYR